MERLNDQGNKRGLHKAPPNHPWFRAKHGSAQFKNPNGYTPHTHMSERETIPTLEDMDEPCPHDICDGSGVNIDEDGYARACLCKMDEELKEVY